MRGMCVQGPAHGWCDVRTQVARLVENELHEHDASWDDKLVFNGGCLGNDRPLQAEGSGHAP